MFNFLHILHALSIWYVTTDTLSHLHLLFLWNYFKIIENVKNDRSIFSLLSSSGIFSNYDLSCCRVSRRWDSSPRRCDCLRQPSALSPPRHKSTSAASQTRRLPHYSTRFNLRHKRVPVITNGRFMLPWLQQLCARTFNRAILSTVELGVISNGMFRIVKCNCEDFIWRSLLLVSRHLTVLGHMQTHCWLQSHKCFLWCFLYSHDSELCLLSILHHLRWLLRSRKILWQSS